MLDRVRVGAGNRVAGDPLRSLACIVGTAAQPRHVRAAAERHSGDGNTAAPGRCTHRVRGKNFSCDSDDFEVIVVKLVMIAGRAMKLVMIMMGLWYLVMIKN